MSRVLYLIPEGRGILDNESKVITNEANKQSSRDWHEAFGTPKLQAAYETFLAKEFRALFFGHGWVDRAAYIKGDQEFVAAFQDVSMSIEDVVGEGDLVMCRMRWRGTQVASVLGIEPSSKRFDVTGFCQDRFESGKVVEHIPLFDVASLMKQISA